MRFYLTAFITCIVLLKVDAQLTCQLTDAVNWSGPPSEEISRKATVGPPGKRGPPGPPGDVRRCNCSSSSTELQREVEDLKSTMQLLKKSLACKGVVDGNTCIRLLKTVYLPMNYANSVEACRYHGGRLAEITTKDIYDKVNDYVKSVWNGNIEYAHLRLGMTYTDGWIVTSEGVRINEDPGFGHWHRGRPARNCAGCKYMSLVVSMVQRKVTEGTYGWFNSDPNHSDIVPLCQFPL